MALRYRQPKLVLANCRGAGCAAQDRSVDPLELTKLPVLEPVDSHAVICGDEHQAVRGQHGARRFRGTVGCDQRHVGKEQRCRGQGDVEVVEPIPARQEQVVAFGVEVDETKGRKVDLEVIGKLSVTVGLGDERGADWIRKVGDQKAAGAGLFGPDVLPVDIDATIGTAGHGVENLVADVQRAQRTSVHWRLGAAGIRIGVEVSVCEHALLPWEERAADDDIGFSEAARGRSHPDARRRTHLLVTSDVRAEQHLDLIVEAKPKEIYPVATLRGSGGWIEVLQVERGLNDDCAVKLGHHAVANDHQLQGNRGQGRADRGHHEPDFVVGYLRDCCRRHRHVTDEDLQLFGDSAKALAMHDRDFCSIPVEVRCDVVTKDRRDTRARPADHLVGHFNALKEARAGQIEQGGPNRHR